MIRLQEQVAEFSRAMGQTIGTTPAIRAAELEANLIEEEAKETVDAIRRGDLVEAADGIIDTIFVCLHAAVAFGIDVEPLWEEVCRTNMLKTTGPVREDGKRLKGPDWKPPRIRELLDEQMRGKR